MDATPAKGPGSAPPEKPVHARGAGRDREQADVLAASDRPGIEHPVSPELPGERRADAFGRLLVVDHPGRIPMTPAGIGATCWPSTTSGWPDDADGDGQLGLAASGHTA